MGTADSRSKGKSFYVLVAVYFVALHAVLLVVLAKSDFLDRVALKLGALSDELSSHYYQMVAFHSRQDANLPEGSVIFIGDSITQGLAVSAVTPLGVNYGIGADTSVGVLRRLDFYTSLESASAIVLAIGVNDLKRRQDEEIIDNMRTILNRMPNTVPILMSAILPIDDAFPRPKTSNTRIKLLNQKLSKLCIELPNVECLDISSQLVDARGSLDPLYHIGDGIHLNPLGYEVWISALKRQLSLSADAVEKKK